MLHTFYSSISIPLLLSWTLLSIVNINAGQENCRESIQKAVIPPNINAQTIIAQTAQVYIGAITHNDTETEKVLGEIEEATKLIIEKIHWYHELIENRKALVAGSHANIPRSLTKGPYTPDDVANKIQPLLDLFAAEHVAINPANYAENGTRVTQWTGYLTSCIKQGHDATAKTIQGLISQLPPS